MAQADFGKLGLNNSHHSGNCHRLSVNSKQEIYAIKLTAREICFSSRSFFTMDGRGFYYYNSSQFPVYFRGNAEYSEHVYSQGQNCGSEETAIETIESPSQNSAPSSSRELVELSGPSSSSSSAEERRVYARWSNDEAKMLLTLWAEIFDRLESREARKAWDDIAKKMNDKFGTKRTTDKYQKKMKYHVDRYKQAKDWNSKQSGGNRWKSAHYDEIYEVLGCRDIVTLQNVQKARSVSEERDTNKTSTDASGTTSKKEARSARKKTKKREREEEKNDEDRKTFKSALSGLETQRSDMNSFVTNFACTQEQQLTTMNALVGALSKFLGKQRYISEHMMSIFCQFFIERFIAHLLLTAALSVDSSVDTFSESIPDKSAKFLTLMFAESGWLHFILCLFSFRFHNVLPIASVGLPSLKEYKIVVFYLLRNGQNVDQYTFY